MRIAEKVLASMRDLSPEKQREVLDFAESLRPGNGPKPPLKSLEGLWAGLGIEITEEDIAEARREMWGNFPRDIS